MMTISLIINNTFNSIEAEKKYVDELFNSFILKSWETSFYYAQV